MIQITGIQQEEVKITDAYLTSDHSALLISNAYSDEEDDGNYQCRELSDYGIAMVSSEGVWTDFDVMTPKLVETAPCSFENEIATQHGFPLIQVKGKSRNICAQKLSGSFVLWFERDMEIELAIINDRTTFYCSGNQLIGISIIPR